jgi:hypothetical protein
VILYFESVFRLLRRLRGPTTRVVCHFECQ